MKSTKNGEETMLILTRKSGSFIRIGPDIVIRVIHTGRSAVKIGIEAPSKVRIIRGELPEYPDRTDQDEQPDEARMLQQ
jgi:carbon storage regulator